MDWITLALLLSTAGLAATLLACLRTLRTARAGTAAPPPEPPTLFLVMVPGGEPQGPIDRSTLRAMLIDGRLDETALAAVVAGGGWRPAAELALADDDGAALPAPTGQLFTHRPWRP